MYQMKITGTFGLRIEGPKEPITYELMFDHMQVDVEGIEPHILADALAVAVHKAMVPSQQAVIDSLERLYPWAADQQVKDWMLALAEAATLLGTESEDDQVVLDSRHLAQRTLRDAGLRPSLTLAEVRRAAAMLHRDGQLSDAFLVGTA